MTLQNRHPLFEDPNHISLFKISPFKIRYRGRMDYVICGTEIVDPVHEKSMKYGWKAGRWVSGNLFSRTDNKRVSSIKWYGFYDVRIIGLFLEIYIKPSTINLLYKSPISEGIKRTYTLVHIFVLLTKCEIQPSFVQYCFTTVLNHLSVTR